MDTLTEVATKEIYVNPKDIRIAKHLSNIDPVLTPYTRILAQPPYEDLTDEAVLASQLKLQDLVAIHLTDTFPKNGIIHPTVFYNPKLLRFTIHFAINGAEDRVPLWGYNWEDKKFAVLIPLDKIKNKILRFHPNETYVLEDLELSEGTIILKDIHNQNTTNAGQAKVIEADFSQGGEKLNGLHRAIYEQIIKQGYFPSKVASNGWKIPVNDTEQARILQKLCQKNDIEFNAGLHALNWTGLLEGSSIDLQEAVEEKDEGRFREIVEQTKERLENEEFYPETEKTPAKYKRILFELIKKYQRQYFSEIKLPILD